MCAFLFSNDFLAQMFQRERATVKGGDKYMSFSEYAQLLKSLREREEGQTMAEYAVVLGVITVACVAVFGILSGAIGGAVTKVTNAI